MKFFVHPKTAPKGAGSSEYGIMAGLVAVVAILGVSATGAKIETLFEDGVAALDGDYAHTGGSGPGGSETESGGADPLSLGSFTAAVDQPVSTLVVSNPITVSGGEGAIPIFVSGGEYSVNSGGWTSAGSTVEDGDTIEARVLSSDSHNTETTVTVSVGLETAEFSVTTEEAPSGLLSFSITPARHPGNSQVHGFYAGNYGSVSSQSSDAGHAAKMTYSHSQFDRVTFGIEGIHGTNIFSNTSLTCGGVSIDLSSPSNSGTSASNGGYTYVIIDGDPSYTSWETLMEAGSRISCQWTQN